MVFTSAVLMFHFLAVFAPVDVEVILFLTKLMAWVKGALGVGVHQFGLKIILIPIFRDKT